MELKCKYNNEQAATVVDVNYKELYEGFFNLIFKFINVGLFNSHIDDTGFFIEKVVDRPSEIDGSVTTISRRIGDISGAGKGNDLLPASFSISDRETDMIDSINVDLYKKSKEINPQYLKNLLLYRQDVIPYLLSNIALNIAKKENETNTLNSFYNKMVSDQSAFDVDSFETQDLKHIQLIKNLRQNIELAIKFDLSKTINNDLFKIVPVKTHGTNLDVFENETLRNMEIIRNLYVLSEIFSKLANRGELQYDSFEEIVSLPILKLDTKEFYDLLKQINKDLEYDNNDELAWKDTAESSGESNIIESYKLDNKTLDYMNAIALFKGIHKIDADSEDIVFKRERDLHKDVYDTQAFKTIYGALKKIEESTSKDRSLLHHKLETMWLNIIKGLAIEESLNHVAYQENLLDIINAFFVETRTEGLVKSNEEIGVYAHKKQAFKTDLINSNRYVNKNADIYEAISFIAQQGKVHLLTDIFQLMKDDYKVKDDIDDKVEMKPKELYIYTEDGQIEIREKPIYYLELKDMITAIKNKRPMDQFDLEVYEKVIKDYKPFNYDFEAHINIDRHLDAFMYEWSGVKRFFQNGEEPGITIVDMPLLFRFHTLLYYDNIEELLDLPGQKGGRDVSPMDLEELKRPDGDLSTLDSDVKFQKILNKNIQESDEIKFFIKKTDDMNFGEALVRLLSSRKEFRTIADLHEWFSKSKQLVSSIMYEEFLSKGSVNSRTNLEEIYVNKLVRDAIARDVTKNVSKSEAVVGTQSTDITMDAKERSVVIESKDMIDKFFSRREVGTAMFRLMDDWISKNNRMFRAEDKLQFIFKNPWSTTVEDIAIEVTPDNKSVIVESPDQALWIDFGSRSVFAEESLQEFRVKEATVLPKQTSQDGGYVFIEKNELTKTTRLDPGGFIDKKVQSNSIEEESTYWADIWKTVETFNTEQFTFKENISFEQVDESIPIRRSEVLATSEDYTILIANKASIDTAISHLELLDQDKIAKSIVTNPDLTMRLTDPYQDFFDSYTFSYDELILPEGDFDYSKFKQELIDESGKPKNPIRMIDGSTFIAKYPVNHPIPKFGDIGKEFVEIDGHLMKFMIEILYRIWQENIFKFGAMDMRESVERMLQYMDIFVDTRIPEQLHKQGKRVIRMFRWYGEHAILERGEYKIKMTFKDFIAPLHTGTVGIENVMINMSITPRYIIQIENINENASIEFTFNNIVEVNFKSSLMLANGTCTIYLNNEIIDVATQGIYKADVTIPTSINPQKLRFEFVPEGSAAFNMSGIKVTNYVYDDISTEYSPKQGLGNAAIDALIRRVTDLSFTLTSEDMAAEVEQMRNGNLAMAELVDKLIQYFNLHHQHKVKGKRLTIKH